VVLSKSGGQIGQGPVGKPYFLASNFALLKTARRGERISKGEKKNRGIGLTFLEIIYAFKPPRLKPKQPVEGAGGSRR